MSNISGKSNEDSHIAEDKMLEDELYSKKDISAQCDVKNPSISHKSINDEVEISHHWLYKEIIDGKEVWHGLSYDDSHSVEELYLSDNNNNVVQICGGRYDVYLSQREKRSVYWESDPHELRRCLWFYKEGLYLPFDEQTSDSIEKLFNSAAKNLRNDSVCLENGETLKIINSNTVRIISDNQSEIKTVCRGVPKEITIAPNESFRLSHLCLVVEGVGTYCDLCAHTIVECVDILRNASDILLSQHNKDELDVTIDGRVEFLPVAWHNFVRSPNLNLQIENITLPHIPKFRYIVNDMLMDVLLYTSNKNSKIILDVVGGELNRLHNLFMQRNPGFKGTVSIIGHSLGSVIVYDILSNQQLPEDREKVASTGKHKTQELQSLFEELELQEYFSIFEHEQIDIESLLYLKEDDLKELHMPMGPRKKLLKFIGSDYLSSERRNFQCSNRSRQLTDHKIGSIPRLVFEASHFFALGSPLAMFLVSRGISIDEDYCLPTCPRLLHIFHPYDPAASRIEKLINPNFNMAPALVAHHKGGKRMHIKLRENLVRIHSELWMKFVEKWHSPWNPMSLFGVSTNPSSPEEEASSGSDDDSQQQAPSSGCKIGNLNQGRRIDHVLQERPIEALSEYIFALGSHVSYWNSEDTVLMILNEVHYRNGT